MIGGGDLPACTILLSGLLIPVVAFAAVRKGRAVSSGRKPSRKPPIIVLPEALEFLHCAVVIVDAGYRICAMNRQARERFGLHVGKMCHAMLMGNGEPCPSCPAVTVLGGGRNFLTHTCRYRDGRWYESSASLFIGPCGTRTAIMLLSDVTEKRKAEDTVREFTRALKGMVAEKTAELRSREEFHRVLMENARDAIFTIDSGSDRIMSANRMAELLTGYTAAEMLRMRSAELDGGGEFKQLLRRLRESPGEAGVRERAELRRKDGGAVPVDVSASLVPCGGGDFMLAICRDISQHLSYEQRLRQLASVVENMSASVLLMDVHGKIIYANPATEKMLGFGAGEMIGRPSAEFFEGIPGNPADMAGLIAREARDGRWEGEMFDRRKTGEIILVHLRMCEVRDEGGRMIGFAGIAEDITRRKELEAELIQKEKLAALGEFTSSIAHELNNPLTGVLGYAQIILEQKCPQVIRDDLQRLYREAVRSHQLVKNLLSFSRRAAPHREPADINQIIESSIDLKSYQFKAGQIEVATELERSIPTALFDANQIQQVFLNILTNAHQALMERDGRRSITVRSALKDGLITISIGDNGPGIPEESLGSIFSPFFSTKKFGQGTGLGLSIARAIVRDHGGDIAVENARRGETMFTIRLPFVPSPGEPGAPQGLSGIP